MDKETSVQLLEDVKKHLLELKYPDFKNLDAIKKKTQLYIDKIFGLTSPYKGSLKKISFSPSIMWGGMSDHHYLDSWEDGKGVLVNLINTMLEDIEISHQSEIITQKGGINNDHSDNLKVFIVHGHNEEMKESVARMLEKISLLPIILHEQPNKGRTIIEKFSDHSDVGFAVVLLSADDVGYSIKQKPSEAKPRARQNVILELGYFIGKLGRNKVVALVQNLQNFEFPSDYQGIIFLPFDSGGNWRFSLLKELKSCNYNVDANALL